MYQCFDPLDPSKSTIVSMHLRRNGLFIGPCIPVEGLEPHLAPCSLSFASDNWIGGKYFPATDRNVVSAAEI
jgi:hypothetical protein